MTLHFTIIVCILSTVLLGCSNRDLYDAVQNNREMNCNLRPVHQQVECLEAYKEPYENYKDALEETNKDY